MTRWLQERRGVSAGDINKMAASGIHGKTLMLPNLDLHLKHPDLDLSLNTQLHILDEVKKLKAESVKCKEGVWFVVV